MCSFDDRNRSGAARIAQSHWKARLNFLARRLVVATLEEIGGRRRTDIIESLNTAMGLPILAQAGNLLVDAANSGSITAAEGGRDFRRADLQRLAELGGQVLLDFSAFVGRSFHGSHGVGAD